MQGFYQFGRFRLYPRLGRLERDGSALDIDQRDVKLLTLLAEKGSQGAKHQEIARTLSTDADTSALRTHVAKLRNILGKEAIETGPNKAYIFRTPVRWVGEDSRSAPGGRRLWWLLAAGLLLAVASAAYLSLRRQPEQPLASWRVAPVTSSAGSEALAAYSPDGNRLAFCWNGENEDAFQIYIRDEASGALSPLSSDSAFHHYSPAWSPDGRSMAFARIGRGSAQFCLGPVDGSKPAECGLQAWAARAEVPGRQLDWSPNGRFLAIVDKAGPREPFRIYRVNLERGNLSGSKRPLTNPQAGFVGDSSPVISPDGTQLVFARVFSQGLRDLFLLDLPTGQETQLTKDNRYIAGVSWRPDGQEVVFSSNRAGALRLWRMRVRPQVEEPVAIGPLVNAVHPAVGPSGAVVYSEFQVNTDIAKLDLLTGTVTQTAFNSSMQDSSPRVARDGRVAFASDRSGSFEIWVTDPAGRNPQQLTSIGGLGAGSPRWSPDGNHIIFDSRMHGDPNLYIIPSRTPGAGPRQLTYNTAEDVVPSWSNDGKYIYFSSSRGGSRHEIWKMPVNGKDSDARQITFGGGFAPFESEDGRYVYYARSRSESGLLRVPVEGGRSEVVLDSPPAGYWAYWSLASDGIYLLEPGTSRSKGPGFDFAIDFISPLAGATVRFYSFDTQSVSDLAVVDDLRLSFLPGLALASDGKSLFLSRVQRSEADLKKLENY
jgi:Tol biopolymer transport system component/DNA-binding winged helix-turn-helix (wHTH) protein